MWTTYIVVTGNFAMYILFGLVLFMQLYIIIINNINLYGNKKRLYVTYVNVLNLIVPVNVCNSKIIL